jgi:hypothetical protein
MFMPDWKREPAGKGPLGLRMVWSFYLRSYPIGGSFEGAPNPLHRDQLTGAVAVGIRNGFS